MTAKDFFPKEIECPVCGGKFETLKVRQAAVQMEKQDSDFCVHYRTINPLFYQIWACQTCSFAGEENDYELSPHIKEDKLKAHVGTMFKKWGQPDLCDERDLDSAMTSYRLAIDWGLFLHRSNFKIGSYYLRMAWMNRDEDVSTEKEMLEKGVSYYRKGYETELEMPRNLGEIGVAYLIGELYRRLGEYQEAGQWFGRVLQQREPQSKEIQRIIALCRDQWQDLKSEMKAQPESAGDVD